MEEINKQKHTSTSREEIESSSSTDSEKADEELWRKKMNLLALLLSFEKYWSPYSLSDGSLYKEEAKEEAGKIVSLFKDLYGVEFFERSDNGDILKPSEKNGTETICPVFGFLVVNRRTISKFCST